MKEIDNYVENLFIGMPHTKEALTIKENMKADLGEKYANLIHQGKNADEALGIICKTFGSMEEIKYELCIDDLMEQDKIGDIMVNKKAKNARLAFGIVCCILACMMPILFTELLPATDTNEIYGVLAFFLFVAAGVYYIITSFAYTFTAKDYISYEEDEKKGKKKRNRFHFSDLIPLSVVAYLFIGFVYGEWHPWWIIIPGSGILFPTLDDWFGLD